MSSSVGYTKDGRVFMHIPYRSNQGEPLETTIHWQPEAAKVMGEFLIDAAEAANAVKNRGKANGNDSTPANRRGT